MIIAIVLAIVIVYADLWCSVCALAAVWLRCGCGMSLSNNTYTTIIATTAVTTAVTMAVTTVESALQHPDWFRFT